MRRYMAWAAACLLSASLLAGCGSAQVSDSASQAVSTAASQTVSDESLAVSQEVSAGTGAESLSQTEKSDSASGETSGDTVTSVTEETSVASDATESAAQEISSAADSATSTADSATSAADPDEGYKLIGTKAEGENTYRVLLKNSTGRGITGIQIKEIHKGEYPDSLMAEDDIFADGEERVLYLDGSEDGDGAEYNVRVTFEDGQVKDITSFPFNDLTSAELKCDDDTLYVSYVSLKTGQEEDTKAREAALRQTAQDAKEAAAAAAAAAQAEAENAGNSSGGQPSSKKEVSRERYDDCDGSGHGYYIITYSDGSTETVEY